MRLVRFVAVVAVGGVSAVLPASAQAAPAVRHYTVHIVTLDRLGHQVSSQPTVADSAQNVISFGIQSVRLPAGRYVVGADIITGGQGSVPRSDTLIAKTITVSGNVTVQLDARTGKPMSVFLNGASASDKDDLAALCDGQSINLALSDDPPGATYVAATPGSVRLFYQSSWESAAGTFFELAGSTSVGKSAPALQGSLSSLVPVHFQLRSGESPGNPGGILYPDHQPGCMPYGNTIRYRTPATLIAYMQAGSWLVDDLAGTRLEWRGRFSLGHAYTVTLGSAVQGPRPKSPGGAKFPYFDTGRIAYSPGQLFIDPIARVIGTCRASIAVTLYRGASRLTRRMLKGCTSVSVRKTVTRSGWYRLTVTGSRATQLSDRVALSWSFYARAGVRLPEIQAVPVTLAQFEAAGLNVQNAARPGGRTRVTVRLVMPVYGFSPAPANAVASARLQASTNGGRTWRDLAVSRRGNDLIADVRDPASGFVSLRSVIVSTAGNRSTETIYRAYAVS